MDRLQATRRPVSSASPDIPAHAAWADAAKGIGIALVYYGHVLASLAGTEGRPGSSAAFDQMHVIYSFHMPLFFLMAGFFYRAPARMAPRILALASRRLVPVLFFGLLLLPLWSWGPIHHGLSLSDKLEPLLEGYLHGHPDLNFVTWFLVCLFVCECAALLLLPTLRSTPVRAIAGLLTIFIGVAACNHLELVERLFAIQGRTWFAYEAIVALGFYVLGQALYPTLARKAERPLLALTACAVGFVTVWLTYRLNPLGDSLTVMMSAGRHGDAMAFALTALAGSLGTIGLAVVASRSRVLQQLGQYSLVLLGLSGLFFHFVNARLAVTWPPAGSWTSITCYATALTACSLLASYPVAVLLTRWLPRLVGHRERHASNRPVGA